MNRSHIFQITLLLSSMCLLLAFHFLKTDPSGQLLKWHSKRIGCSFLYKHHSEYRVLPFVWLYNPSTDTYESEDRIAPPMDSEEGEQSNSSSEFDSILSEYNEPNDYEMLPLADEQLLESLLNRESKPHTASGVQFAAVLKTLAARRFQLDGTANSHKRHQLIQSFIAYIAANNASTGMDKIEFAEVLSNCVWAMGTLKLTRDDFATAPPLATTATSSAQWDNRLGNWELLISAAVQVCEGQDADIAAIVDKSSTGEATATVKQMSRVQLFRLISGLGKMGLKWRAMPALMQRTFMQYTSNMSHLSPEQDPLTVQEWYANYGDGAGTQAATTAVQPAGDLISSDPGVTLDDTADRDTSREIASTLYILGQIGATKALLAGEYVQSLLTQLNQDHIIQGFTAPGLFNALHGLAMLQLLWQGDIPASLQRRLLFRATELLGNVRLDEYCSFLKSVAVLKVDWVDLSAPLQTLIVRSLLLYLPVMSCRETIVAVWSLGKLGLSFRELNRAAATTVTAPEPASNEHLYGAADVADSAGAAAHIVRAAQASPASTSATAAVDIPQLQLLQRLRSEMLSKLETVTPHMTLFDSESLLLALGLMDIQYTQLPSSYARALHGLLQAQLPHMNIFNLHNVLWGLARIKADVHSAPATSGSKQKQQVQNTLSAALWENTLAKLHVFLPAHYGDILWALGSLGFSVGTPSTVPPAQLQRMLAVLSRVYHKLPVRGATYVLWGLSRMNVRWEEHLSVCPPPTNALYGNRTFVMHPIPLAESILRYLRTRVASMREHEFAVMLTSLGRMGARWSDLPEGTTSKLSHRITRVSPYFTSRSLSGTLQGLALMKVPWSELSQQSRDALQAAMLSPFPYTTSADSRDDISSSVQGSGRKAGLRDMRNKELAAAIHSLGTMRADWSTLTPELQAEIVQTTAKRVNTRNIHFRAGDLIKADGGDSVEHEQVAAHTLSGLCEMRCPADLVPIPLVSAATAQLRQLHHLSTTGSIDQSQQQLFLDLIKGLAYVHKGTGNTLLLGGVSKAEQRAWLEGVVTASTSTLTNRSPATKSAIESTAPSQQSQSVAKASTPPADPHAARMQEQKEAWLALIYKGKQASPLPIEPVAAPAIPAPAPATAPYDPTEAVAALSALADLGGNWQELSTPAREAVVDLLALSQRSLQNEKTPKAPAAGEDGGNPREVTTLTGRNDLFTMDLLQKLFNAVSRLRQKRLSYPQ